MWINRCTNGQKISKENYLIFICKLLRSKIRIFFTSLDYEICSSCDNLVIYIFIIRILVQFLKLSNKLLTGLQEGLSRFQIDSQQFPLLWLQKEKWQERNKHWGFSRQVFQNFQRSQMLVLTGASNWKVKHCRYGNKGTILWTKIKNSWPCINSSTSILWRPR